jgi:transposase InsO family protein
MAIRTTPDQRRRFYQCHLRGETYQEIANSTGLSKWTVRHWCRRQRQGGECQTRYGSGPRGLLNRFDPKVRYCVLRLRLEHPRWGPNRILAGLEKRPSLRGCWLPSEASIGRYLHQWSQFRRPCRKRVGTKRPDEPTRVHQRWQIDFKMGIALKDGTLVNLHTVRDPLGAACIGAFVFAAGRVGQQPRSVTLEQVQSVLRTCFARWKTLPEEVQTDGESILIGRPEDPFPTKFTLWLKGLGIEHLVIRLGRPTDNAEVERCHRTVSDYAIVGNEKANVAQLQQILDHAVYELNWELASQAKGCQRCPPVKAHPELLQPRRPFQAGHELALFDLNRVDAYLTTFTWERKASITGQIYLGAQRYTVGRHFARRQILIRFDAEDRQLVFYDAASSDEQVSRRPIKSLAVADLTGLAEWPVGLGCQQLPLPWIIPEGVDC